MIFEVDRTDFRQTRTVDEAATSATVLAAGQVRLRVDRFAFTSNNVTYAAAGDMLDYWSFFPAKAPWGRIPAMGLATVVESANPDIEAGSTYFGWYPMAAEVVIDARPVAAGIRDIGEHRNNHAGTYVTFADPSKDPMFSPDRADHYLLLKGLFTTSWLIDDFLGDADFRGAEATIITSASSKTSISLATCLDERDGVAAIGLTSAGNRSFVEGLGLYDQVATYDEIDQLASTEPAGLVDMAGNAAVRSALHHRYGDQLAFSLTVGLTHWDAAPVDPAPLPGPAPEFFFAPTQVTKRNEDWGSDGLQARIADSFAAMVDRSDGWLRVEHRARPDAVEATYRDLLEGSADPALGFICSMSSEALA